MDNQQLCVFVREDENSKMDENNFVCAFNIKVKTVERVLCMCLVGGEGIRYTRVHWIRTQKE